MVGYDGVIAEARTQPGLFLRVARVAGFSHDWRLLAQRSHANGAFGGTNRGRGRDMGKQRTTTRNKTYSGLGSGLTSRVNPNVLGHEPTLLIKLHVFLDLLKIVSIEVFVSQRSGIGRVSRTVSVLEVKA